MEQEARKELVSFLRDLANDNLANQADLFEPSLSDSVSPSEILADNDSVTYTDNADKTIENFLQSIFNNDHNKKGGNNFNNDCNHYDSTPDMAAFIKSELGDTPYITLGGTQDFSHLTGTKSIAAYYKKNLISRSRHWAHIYIDFFNFIRTNYPELFDGPNLIKDILLPISEFNYRTGMVGYQTARPINNTNYCVITQRSTANICANMQKVVEAFGLIGEDLIIAYEDTQKNSHIACNNAYNTSSAERKNKREPTSTVRIRHKHTENQSNELNPIETIANRQQLAQHLEAIQPEVITSKTQQSHTSDSASNLLQLARQNNNWNAFVILHIIENGPQTQRQLLDAYGKQLDRESENRCRSILYWWSCKFDWFKKTGDKYNYSFSIPNVSECLSNWYVKRIMDKITDNKETAFDVSIDNSQRNIDANPNEPLPDPHSIEPNDDEEGRIIDILRDYFTEGYGGGPKQQYRFAQRFEERYYRKCRIEGDALDTVIARLTWQIDDKSYRPETLLSDENDDRLIEAIGKMFRNGAPYIEYQALLDCQDEEGDSYLLPIKTADDLCTYLRYIHADYTYFPQKFAEDNTPANVDISRQITEFILNRGDWVSLDELRSALPYLSRNTIIQNIDSDVMLENPKEDAWIHIENVGLDDSDFDTLGEYIANGLRESAPLNYQSLFERLPDHIADCLQNLPKDVMRSLLTMKYGERYAFKAVINDIGASSNLDAALENEFCHQDRITMSDIEDLMKRTGTLAYSTVFTYIYSNFCRISESDFVKANDVHFDVYAIDSKIAAQHKGDYILMRDIVFDDFPYAGYQWNKYLLYSYIYRYSERYELKTFANFPIKKGEGGIALRKNNKQNYDDILQDYLLNLAQFPANETDALDLLSDAGLIERKNKRANEVYESARKVRNRNE